MRSLFLIPFLVIPAFAADATAIEPLQDTSDDISIQVINDWTLPEKALDLAIMETMTGPVVIGIDNGDDVIRIWENGLTSEEMTLPPASSGHSWGVACRNDGDTAAMILVNDFDSFDLYTSDDIGVTWGTATDPGGKYSRGMDYDGTHYWTVINGYTDQLCRFQPGGSSETWEIPEIGATQQGSGLAVFPLSGGDTGIALAVFDIGMFFFYGYDGSDVYYIGSVETPFSASVLVSLGLAYCESSEHFFWTYGPTSGYRMVEFTVSMNPSSLEENTWGAIKTGFQE